MKTNIGAVRSKKNRHNLSSSVTTTSQVGFCQPILCRELIPHDFVKIRTASQVFLQPVVKPTFGRLTLRNYKGFVPIEEIYHPFGSFLSGKPYNGAINQYIPSEVPNLPLNMLTVFCYAFSRIYAFIPESMSFSDDKLSAVRGDFEDEAFAEDAWYDAICDRYMSSKSPGGVTVINVCKALQQDGYTTFGQANNDGVSLESMDWFFVDGTSSIICGRFSDRGKNLRKILLGLGYQLSLIQDSKTVLPIVAYYKLWFDLFAIQREITWKETPCYGFMEYLEQSGVFLEELVSDDGEVSPQRKFVDFLVDLTECYYTQNPDYASAHIVGLGKGEPESFRLLQNTSAGPADTSDVVSGRDSQPLITDGVISQQRLDILKVLYERINKATAIGGRIKEFMRAIFGSDYGQDDESNFIGSSISYVDITQVMSTAETSEGFLGEYAGKGVGSSVGNYFDFTARKPGYLIEFFAIVPDSRLAQGVDPNLNHIRKYDFYNDKFDSITLLPTRKLNIYGTRDMAVFGDTPYDPNDAFASGFGNIPNYMEYKVKYDIVNGDVSMMSTRESLLPFTFSKLLPYTKIIRNSSGFTIRNTPAGLITAGDLWRYVGRDRWLGNYDHIFVNEGQDIGFVDSASYRMDDNFICYFYIDLAVSSISLATADSFQTDPFGDHLTVEKA